MVEAAAYFVVAAAVPTGGSTLDVTICADAEPDGDGIDVVLSGAIPQLTAFAATDEARRVTALGGVVGPGGAGAVRIRVPGVASTAPAPAVAEARS